MIDETIGNIGSTQGVSESSRPAMKKAPTIGQKAPPRSTASMPEASCADEPIAAVVAVAAVVAMAEVVATLAVVPPAEGGSAAASTRALPVPPKATRPIAADACCGG